MLGRIEDGVVSWVISFTFWVIVIILNTLQIWVKVVEASGTLEFISRIWVYEKLSNRKVETNRLLFAHCEAERQILQFWEEVVDLFARTSTDLSNSFQIYLDLIFFLRDRWCLSKVLTVLLRREIAKDCTSFGVMNAAINITRLFFVILIVIRIDSVMSWFLTEETSKENGVDNTFFIALRSDKFGISRPNSLTHLNRLLLAKCLLLSATSLTLLTRCHGHCVTKLARNIIVCVIKRVI